MTRPPRSPARTSHLLLTRDQRAVIDALITSHQRMLALLAEPLVEGPGVVVMRLGAMEAVGNERAAVSPAARFPALS